MTNHDKRQKGLFTEPGMVASMIRVFAAELGISPEELARFDFGTMDPMLTELEGTEYQARFADRVWRIFVRGAPGGEEPGSWWYVLFEFQADYDPEMLPRMMEYESMLYRLVRTIQGLGADDPWPPVLPTVMHHGDRPWPARTEVRNFYYHLIDAPSIDLDKLPDGEIASEWVRCERADTKGEALAAVLRAFDAAPRDNDDGLRRAFHARAVSLMPEEDFPSYEWCLEAWRGEGPVESRLARKVREWNEVQQGIGEERGLEAERALLCRQAVRRFGEEVSGRLSVALVRITDFERLEEVGEWLVVCETGEELLSRLDKE